MGRLFRWIVLALILSACAVAARQQTPLELATSLRSCVYSLQLKNDAGNRSTLAQCKSLADRLVAALTPAPCTFAVAPMSVNFPAGGGVQTANVSASAGSCGWTAGSSVGWLTVQPSSGSGNGSVSITATANTGSARNAVVTVAGQSVGVTQDGVQPPSSCVGIQTDGSQPSVQAAVDSAVDGNTVCVPAGNFPWADPVVIDDKNIHVRGSGIDQTVVSGTGSFLFYIDASSNHGQVRISGFTFTGSSAAVPIVFTSESNAGIVSGWRFDHNKFQYTSGSRTGISLRGVTYGLIDHNEFVWSQGFAIHAAAYNASDGCSTDNPAGNFINSQPLDLGTANAIYIEDNTFISTGNGGITAYDTSAGGARAVFRHNTVTGGFYYSHWTRGCEIGGILHEIYNNTFIGNGDYGISVGAGYPIRIEAGTGVIFNNYADGFHTGSFVPYVYLDERRQAGGTESGQPLWLTCDGTRPWDGNSGDPAAPGWPCLGQIGRSPGKSMSAIQAGDTQTSAPLYLWNNGTQASCATGGVCADSWDVYADPPAYIKATPHPNGDVDYVKHGSTPKPGYLPYTYPHPLQVQ